MRYDEMVQSDQTLRFHSAEGGGKDVFSAVERAGLSRLNEGQQIAYEIEEDPGKTSAVNLKVKCEPFASFGRSLRSRHGPATLVAEDKAEFVTDRGEIALAVSPSRPRPVPKPGPGNLPLRMLCLVLTDNSVVCGKCGKFGKAESSGTRPNSGVVALLSTGGVRTPNSRPMPNASPGRRTERTGGHPRGHISCCFCLKLHELPSEDDQSPEPVRTDIAICQFQNCEMNWWIGWIG